jgi:hypothetical protein
MRILASDQVAGWLRNLPPEPKRRVRVALKGLKRWQGDTKPLRSELVGIASYAA